MDHYFFKFAVHYLSNGPEDFRFRWHLWGPQALDNFSIEKRKLIFFGQFFFQIRGPLSQQWTWGFRFRWHLWGPLGLRQFFYRKRKLIFFGPFLFKFAVHYLRNGPEDFGSDDIYEVPRPQTIFVYIYKKIFLGPFFFSNSRSLSQDRTWGFRVRWTFLRSPDITLGQSQCAIWKSMQKVKRFFFLGIYIFLWVAQTLRVQTDSSWGKCRQHNGHNGHDQSTSK